MRTLSSHRLAIAALLAVTLLWGLSFPTMKMAALVIERVHASTRDAEPDSSATNPCSNGYSEGEATSSSAVSPITAAAFFTALRFVLALMAFAVYRPSLPRLMSGREWWMGTVLGVVFAVGVVLQVTGLQEIPASRSGFLTSLGILFIPLLMLVTSGCLPGARTLAGIPCALAGTAFLTGFCEVTLRSGVRIRPEAVSGVGAGDAITLAASFFFALHIVLTDAFGRRVSADRLTLGMFPASAITAGIAFFLLLKGRHGPSGQAAWFALLATPSFFLLVLLVGILCTALPFTWMNKYLPSVSPVLASLIYACEPIFATFWAWLLPDLLSPVLGIEYRSEILSLNLLAGGLLVVAGVILSAPSSGNSTRKERRSITPSNKLRPAEHLVGNFLFPGGEGAFWKKS